MGFFTEREREKLDRAPRATGGASEFVRQPREREELDTLPQVTGGVSEPVPQQQDSDTDGEITENDLGILLPRAARAWVREIDSVITDLQMMREKLHSEASRVQREMVVYASFSETASQSSRVICESLRTGLRPFKHKRRKEKARANARRKAAGRSASAATKAPALASDEPKEGLA
jgi:hypothetical protein